MYSTPCANPNVGPSDGSKTTTLLSGKAFELVVRVRRKQETLSEMLRPAVKHKASSVANSETLVSTKQIREAKASCEVQSPRVFQLYTKGQEPQRPQVSAF